MDEVDDFLEHFGVKGMRWGVRKGLDSSIKKGGLNERNVNRHNRNVAARRAKGKPIRSEQIGRGARRVAEILGLVGPLPVRQATQSPTVQRGRSRVDRDLRLLESFERHDPGSRLALDETNHRRLDRDNVTDRDVARAVARSRRENPEIWE